MGKRACFALVLCVMVFAVISCTDKAVYNANREPDDSQKLGTPPRENEEAELIALYLSDDLVAPQDLYDRVVVSLDSMESLFADSIYMLYGRAPIKFYDQTRYQSLITVGKLTCVFDGPEQESVREGTYDAWDSLNAYFRLDSIVLREYDFIHRTKADLYFIPRLNPVLLCEDYSELPGVNYTLAHFYEIGDRPRMVPAIKNGTIWYLLHYGYGDCPAGCIHAALWLMRETASGVEYVGFYDTGFGGPKPEWFDFAMGMIENYRNYGVDRCF